MAMKMGSLKHTMLECKCATNYKVSFLIILGFLTMTYLCGTEVEELATLQLGTVMAFF